VELHIPFPGPTITVHKYNVLKYRPGAGRKKSLPLGHGRERYSRIACVRTRIWRWVRGVRSRDFGVLCATAPRSLVEAPVLRWWSDHASRLH